MHVCSHSSDGHLSFNSAPTCHKLIITLNIQIFPYICSRPVLGMISIEVICFLGEHSWVLLAILCCLQKYLSNICMDGSSQKRASSQYTLYNWLIQGLSVQEFKRKLVELWTAFQMRPQDYLRPFFLYLCVGFKGKIIVSRWIKMIQENFKC